MQFNVSQLLKESIGSRRVYLLDGPIEPLPETDTDWVQGTVEAVRIDQGILVTGSLRANAFGPCSRCLGVTEIKVRFELAEEYFPSVSEGNHPEAETYESMEGILRLDERHTLDIAEATRQYVLVNMPMKMLCDVGCLGLCNYCGKDLNIGSCSCEENRDIRWEPLLKLLENTDNK